MLGEAAKMPGPMRRDRARHLADAARRREKKRQNHQEEFADLRSEVVTEFGMVQVASRETARVVPANVTSMANTSADGLLLLGQNTNSILGAFGARRLSFSVRR